MAAPLLIGAVWAQSLAHGRAHGDTLLTLAAAFLLLPQMIMGLLAADGAAAGGGAAATVPPLHYFIGTAATLLLDLVFVCTVAALVCGAARRGETIGETMRRMLRPALRLMAALLLLAIPIALLLAVALTSGGGLPALTPANSAAVLAHLTWPVGLAISLAGFLLSALILPLPAVLVAEERPVLDAIGRNWRLAWPQFGRLLLLHMAVLLAAALVSAGVDGLRAALGVTAAALGAKSLGAVLALFVQAAIGAGLTTLWAILGAVAYRQLRAAADAPVA